MSEVNSQANKSEMRILERMSKHSNKHIKNESLILAQDERWRRA